MKSIFLKAESQLAVADIGGVEFTRAASDKPEDQRAVAQLVENDETAEHILRHPWCAEAPAEPAAPEPPRAIAGKPETPKI